MIVDHCVDITSLETVDLDGLGIELETLLLVDEEFLHILALIALKLDDFTHGGIRHDGSIASCGLSVSREILRTVWCALHSCMGLPNFFLMTLRIFFWSNFLGSPWTVVKVLRPLRSVQSLLASLVVERTHGIDRSRRST